MMLSQNPPTPARDPLDPFPWYRQMRISAPVSQVQGFAWHVFRYGDVQRALSDFATFSSERGRRMQGDVAPQHALAASLISTDPPRHRQLRNLVTQAFTPRAVEAMAPRIERIVSDLLDAVEERGEMDLIHDFAYPLPVIVIAQLLGVPPEDRAQFKEWSDAVVEGTSGGVPEKVQATQRAQMEMAQYFMRLIERRRRDPGDDLISGLLAAEIDGEHLSQTELLGFCALLLVAGNETTTNLIGNAMLCFDEAPDQMALLRADLSLLPGAIEEVLRHRSPVQSMYRTVARDAELGGQRLAEGDWVVAWIGSANRDDQVFEAPDRFDVRRAPTKHLAFGHGIHFCLGAPLARLEAYVGLRAVLERLRGIRRVADAPLVPVGGQVVYGVKSLPVAFDATRRARNTAA